MIRTPHKIFSVFLLIMVSFSFFSCSLTIEKRRYRPGYHIETSHAKRDHHHRSDLIKKNKLETAILSVPASPQVTTDSLKDDLLITEKMTEKSGHGTVRKESIQRNSLSVDKKNALDAEECDLLVLKDGTQIEVLVSEITDTEIKYKKCNNPDGPTYVVSSSRVDVIHLKNGDFYRPNPSTNSDQRPVSDQGGFVVAILVVTILAVFSATLAFIFSFFGSPLNVIGFIIGCISLIEGFIGSIMALAGLRTKDSRVTISLILGILAIILSIIAIVVLFV